MAPTSREDEVAAYDAYLEEIGLTDDPFYELEGLNLAEQAVCLGARIRLIGENVEDSEDVLDVIATVATQLRRAQCPGAVGAGLDIVFDVTLPDGRRARVLLDAPRRKRVRPRFTNGLLQFQD